MSPEKALEALRAYETELTEILSRFIKSRDSITISTDDDPRFRQIVLELKDFSSDELVDDRNTKFHLIRYFNESVVNFLESPSYKGVENIRGVVSSLITRIERNPLVLKSGRLIDDVQDINGVEKLDMIAGRFHFVVRQLRQRHDNRPTLDVNDEYDVQDLYHSLLRLYFDDIRPEEWVPSYAGSSSRVDFLLPDIETVVEIKKTRQSLSTKQLGEQLIIDIAKYKKHPQCRYLYCFVYDPEGRVANPRGLEKDLSQDEDTLKVQVYISPKNG